MNLNVLPTGVAPGSQADYQNDYLAKVHPGTGQWIFTNSLYRDWVNGDGPPMLLLPGIPGAGKTFIASIVIGDLQRRVSRDGNAALAFFYNSFKRSAAQSRLDIVSSFARQLYLQRPRSIEVVTGLYNEHQGRAPATQPGLEEICLALEKLLLGFKSVYFVIDALDEGQGPAESDDRPWRYVLSLLYQMVKKLGSEVAIKIIATSRPNLEPEIDGLFATEERLIIQAHDEDVGMFCDVSIGNIRCVARKPELQLKVKDAICESANGMYVLWHDHYAREGED
jgi:hypothetical protein